ncbi:HNH endonuclease [Xanthomonas campestris pv. incanae]|uniref:HNH endonuclease n=1 Tax=Xanthomonas campestris TaxID=339 RepID=UPI003F4CCDCB
MLISNEPAVVALGMSPEEAAGLDRALAEVRRVLGPLDAYMATYAGMRNPTLIFGRKAVDARKGNPLLVVRKVRNTYVLGFAKSQKSGRQVLQYFFDAGTWSDLIKGEVYPLEKLAENSSVFASKMKKLGTWLKKEHKDLYEVWIEGESLMPSDYLSDDGHNEQGSLLLRELQQLSSEPSITTREQLIDARLGQGKFRREVLSRWDGRCAVTGCSVVALLRASHVQPWAYVAKASRRLSGGLDPRLDPDNGLPLVATLDALFDSGLMTFNDDGGALFADALIEKELVAMKLIPAQARLRSLPGDVLKHYLQIHRDEVFQRPRGSARQGRAAD